MRIFISLLSKVLFLQNRLVQIHWFLPDIADKLDLMCLLKDLTVSICSKPQRSSAAGTSEATCVSDVCVLIVFMAEIMDPRGAAEPVPRYAAT